MEQINILLGMTRSSRGLNKNITGQDKILADKTGNSRRGNRSREKKLIQQQAVVLTAMRLCVGFSSYTTVR